ncbi:MAG: SusC/RagA family TonB-linked outer membrane protein, partial [bacterium]
TDASRNIYQPKSLPYAASFGGRADVRNNEFQNVLFEPTLNYRLNIGASQKLEAWVGYTFQEFENRAAGTAAEGFGTDAFSFDNLEAGSVFPKPFSFRSKNRLISFLGRVIYNISDKYLFNAALRREGSSRFGTDNKWGMFPSGSIGWRLSQESFLQSFRSLSDLKLRVSYGITGNQDIGDYRSLIILGTGANAVIGDQVRTGIGRTQIANSDLKWEETTQLNLGLDFGLFQDRLSGSIDVYSKKTEGLLLEFDVPLQEVETRIDNAGTVENKGIEISLNTVNIASGGLFWRTNVNFAANKNEVTSLGKRKEIITGIVSGAGLSGERAQIVRPGEPLGTFYGKRFLGYDAEGKEILSANREILGNAQPDYTFGISNSVNYKNFDLRVFIQGVQGFELLNNTRLEYQRPSNVFNGINLFRGAVADVAAGLSESASPTLTDRFIEDGSFIRLQNVTLGYTFPTGWLKNLRSLRAYLSADNLFIITDYQGYDPEVNNFAFDPNDPSARVPSLGIDYANYPRARIFTFGFNLGF